MINVLARESVIALTDVNKNKQKKLYLDESDLDHTSIKHVLKILQDILMTTN